MDSDFLVAFDDFSRRYWPLLLPAIFLTAWLFHYFLFRQQLRAVLRRLRKHQITGRQERLRLRESEERLRIILSAIQTGVAVINPANRIIEFVNPAACKMIGLGKEHILGCRIEEFEVRVDQKKGDEFYTGLPSDDGVRHRELLRATGEHFPVLEKVVPITINGTVFTLKTYLDLTDLAITRRQVERLHTNLTKRVQELHCLFGVAGALGDASLTRAEVLDKVTTLLPMAMTFPHLAGAKLTMADYETQTENFGRTPWLMAGAIKVAGEKWGEVAISYAEHPPLEGERLFSREERVLLETVCSRLARYLEGLEAARDRALFKGLMDHTSNAVFVFDRHAGRLSYINVPACRLLDAARQELLSQNFEDFFDVEGGMSGLSRLLEQEGLGRSAKVEMKLHHAGTTIALPPATCLLLGEGQNAKVAVLVDAGSLVRETGQRP